VPVAIAVLLYVASVYLLFQCGRVYMRLNCAALYPRAHYFGEADIAPEDAGTEATSRRAPAYAAATALALVALVAAVELIMGFAAPYALIALALGIALESVLALRRDPAQREETLRGGYVLYLRSFSRARSWLVLATALAAAPCHVVAILSPQRTEARSWGWYLIGALFPVQFGRIGFWTTSDRDWHRVVGSCMHYSRAIVFDCSGVPVGSSAGNGASGLTLELGMSNAHADEHPVAFVTERGRPLPVTVPTPSVLETSGDPAWVVQHFRSLVARLRAVLTRTLSTEELAYLDQYYGRFAERWTEAAIRDRNLARREGRRDPHELLMARDPQAELLRESEKMKGRRPDVERE
jgi:hypothetical protein